MNCAVETEADDFVIGLTKQGTEGVLEIEIVAASPAPPARGDNDWSVLVRAIADSAPADGAEIVVTPFMPKHQHGTGVDTVVTPMSTLGQYELSPVNLWMPGLWEVAIDVESEVGDDSIVFKVCIPG